MTASPASTSALTAPPIDFAPIGPRIGEPFPDLRLPDQRGRMVDLHAARAGQQALVVFYRSAVW